MTRDAQVAWWTGLDPQRQARWKPLLAAMTDAERETFHRERQDARASFHWPENSTAGDHERARAEMATHWLWRQRLGARVVAEAVTEAECLS